VRIVLAEVMSIPAAEGMIPLVRNPLGDNLGDGGMPMNNESRPADAEPLIIPNVEARFSDETRIPLLDDDRDRFLDLMDNPPEPSVALRRAAARYGIRPERSKAPCDDLG
jgi:hypothetical protein